MQGNPFSELAKQGQITDECAAMLKILLKELVKGVVETEKKEDRMLLLPVILEGIDLFEVKR